MSYLSLILFSLSLQAAPTLEETILSQGVPQRAVEKLFNFLHENMGRTFEVDVYKCIKHPGSFKPCKETERQMFERTVVLKPHRYAVIVDYSENSMEKRFFLINMMTGQVRSYHAAHGKGSGDGLYAYRFGDIKNSKATALGMYLAGPTYFGDHGLTLRMYGLEESNGNAYARDIVLHGAWYMRASFMAKLNPKTGIPFGRLGVSWGCPAVDPDVAKQIIPLIQNGALIYHYREELADQSLDGRAVELDPPVPLPRPRPNTP